MYKSRKQYMQKRDAGEVPKFAYNNPFLGLVLWLNSPIFHPAGAAFHMGAIPCPSSHILSSPLLWPRKAPEDGPGPWDLVPEWETQKEASDSWLLIGSVLTEPSGTSKGKIL